MGMPVLGLSYTKISAQRRNPEKAPTEVNINTTPKIVSVKKSALKGLGDKPADLISIEFEVSSTFDPDLGEIAIEGAAAYVPGQGETSKAILDHWKKNKVLPPDAHVEVINHLFRKVLVLALQLADALNLPPVLNMPALKKKDQPAG